MEEIATDWYGTGHHAPYLLVPRYLPVPLYLLVPLYLHAALYPLVPRYLLVVSNNDLGELETLWIL